MNIKIKAYVSLKDDVPSFLNPGTVIGVRVIQLTRWKLIGKNIVF